jgi:hypothetical protein
MQNRSTAGIRQRVGVNGLQGHLQHLARRLLLEKKVEEHEAAKTANVATILNKLHQ